MDLDEVHQCLQKHTEHLQGRRRKEGRMGQKRKRQTYADLTNKEAAVTESEAEKGSALQPSRKKKICFAF